VKIARRVHSGLDAYSTGYILTNTMIFKKNYTRNCARQCVLHIGERARERESERARERESERARERESKRDRESDRVRE
jgi:hypothetical protein